MDTDCSCISYLSTGHFSKILTDYINRDEKLTPFYRHDVSLKGVQQAIEARKSFSSPRALLVKELRKQYEGLTLTQKQEDNLQLLLQPNTFTTCTAHQPVIFTGPLYFIYKILHAIKLADKLTSEISGCNFVPFYYMGSEDADLDELGQLHINGRRLSWQTSQTGAVGRMKVDSTLLDILQRIAGEIEVQPFGKQLTSIFKKAYTEGKTIQQATLEMVNELFKEFGLLILIPDNAELKRFFEPVVRKELLEQFSHPLVEETGKRISEHYKVQASGRELNLFYLTESARERIEKEGENFKIDALDLSFTKAEMLHELEQHPERFSANVILRGVFQESILPNIAFIGGGGETAYWLELESVFKAADVPYPLLIIRNSFLLLNERQERLIKKLGFEVVDFFSPSAVLFSRFVEQESNRQVTLKEEKAALGRLYSQIAAIAGRVDLTLSEHTKALHTQAAERIEALEKKLLRAEKRKFKDSGLQIERLKQQLFPHNGLQERTENFSPFYARNGKEWIDHLYHASPALEQCLTILKER